MNLRDRALAAYTESERKRADQQQKEAQRRIDRCVDEFRMRFGLPDDTLLTVKPNSPSADGTCTISIDGLRFTCAYVQQRETNPVFIYIALLPTPDMLDPMDHFNPYAHYSANIPDLTRLGYLLTNFEPHYI